MADKGIDESGACLQRHLSLMWLEHEGEVDLEAVLVELQGQVMSAQHVGGCSRVECRIQVTIAGEKLAVVLVVDGTGVGNLDDNPPGGEDLPEPFRLIQNLRKFRVERIVQLDRDVAARAKHVTQGGHDLVAVLELVPNVRLGVVKEQVGEEAGVAGEVPKEWGNGLNYVRIRGIDDLRRLQLAVLVVRDVPLQVHNEGVPREGEGAFEPGRSLLLGSLDVGDDLLQLGADFNVLEAIRQESKGVGIDRGARNSFHVVALPGLALKVKILDRQIQGSWWITLNFHDCILLCRLS